MESMEYLLQFTDISNNFRLIEKIGEGSFAVVFAVVSKQMVNLKEKFALKFTIPTIEPKRIENELRILKKIGGRKNVVKLHLSFRIKDHIFMLMPYIDHSKFMDYYLLMDLKEIKDYIRNLLIALEHVHDNKIIHRDVKPNNFLYDRQRKKFTLIDFGLAHSESHGDLGSWFDDDLVTDIANDKVVITRSDSTSSFKNSDAQSQKTSLLRDNSSEHGSAPTTASCVCGNRLSTCLGCRSKPRPMVRRGGTIGYRPPEVMMRHAEQTVAVDVWAVGVVLAVFLSGHYPLVRAEDDLEAFFSLTYLLSLERMQAGARAIERRVIMSPKPRPLIGDPVAWLRDRCQFMRKHCPRIDRSAETCVLGPDYEFGDDAYDLLSALLEPNMHTRVSCKDALRHRFFGAS